MNKLLFWLCLLQGVFYFLTGIWGIVHIESFIAVTGPKYDIWLVKTVGALVAVIGIVFASAALRKKITLEIFMLAMGCTASLAAIDIYYASIDRIWNVYLTDAVTETIFFLFWLFFLIKKEYE